MKILFLVLAIFSRSFAFAETPECKLVQKNLGQVLYATVYFSEGKNSERDNQKYFEIVKNLNLGGVLPHYYSREAGVSLQDRSIYDWNQKIKSLTSPPPLIGVDYVNQCGLGVGKGILALAPAGCKKAFFDFEAACHAAYGITQALGPTIERSSNHPYSENPDLVKKDAEELIASFNRYGIATTLKHFPYTPEAYNLHRQSNDTNLDQKTVDQKLQSFKNLATRSDFAMSTHLYNSAIDAEDMATFSKPWVAKLRNEAGFDGILMTDALFMISSYQENMIAMSKRIDLSAFKMKFDDETVFAIRALLAGHDMVFLDGNSEHTLQIYKEFSQAVCQNHPIAEMLRARVLKSSAKIAAFKKVREKNLRAKNEFNQPFLDEVEKIFKNAQGKENPFHCSEIEKAVKLYPPALALESYHFPRDAEKDCSSVPGPKVDLKGIEKMVETIEADPHHPTENPL